MVGHWPSMESQKNNSMKANNPGRNSEIQIPVGASEVKINAPTRG